jgi:hypothetical protein
MTQQPRQMAATDSDSGFEVVWRLQSINDKDGKARRHRSAGPNILVKGDL